MMLKRMVHIDETHKLMQEGLTNALKRNLNIVGSRRTLEVDSVEFAGNKRNDDFRGQLKARDSKGHYAQVVKATFNLKDNQTGKILSKKKVNVGHLPVLTNRLSYLLGGREYQVQSQFRRRSGVYTRVADNGQLQAVAANERKGQLKMVFEPNSRLITIQPIQGSSTTLSLYALLRGAGRTDEEISKNWGSQVVTANKVKFKNDLRLRQELIKVAKKVAEPGEQFQTAYLASRVIFRHLKQFTFDARITQDVLGRPHGSLSEDAVMDIGTTLLAVSRGEKKPSTYDNLGHKKFLGPEDLLEDYLDRKGSIIKRRVKNKIDREVDIDRIVRPNSMNREIIGFFRNGGETQLSSEADQTNPVAMVAGHNITTLKGIGGISIGPGMQLGSTSGIHSSQVGFLDPVDTGEKQEAGLILQSALSAGKKNNTIVVRMYATKTKKMVEVDPLMADRAVVGFPDEYTWAGGHPKPIRATVRAALPGGKLEKVKPSKVDYIIRTSIGQFGLPTNLIPFLGNNNGNRVMIAAKMATQSMSLVNREEPLVQISTPTSTGMKARTMEQLTGKLSSANSPVDGVVEKVSKDEIHVRGVDRKVYKIQLYNMFPTNDKKGILQHTPLVKVTDKVKKGQPLADSNFTKNGTLALGTNLKVGYVPVRGYNFEDGVVISRTASQKMKSEHMYKFEMQSSVPFSRKIAPRDMNKLDDGAVIISKSQYMSWAPSSARLLGKSIEKLDDAGVIKKGSRVERGDILIAAVRKSRTDNSLITMKKTTKFNAPFKSHEIKWDKDVVGKVGRVVFAGNTVTVYVITQEDMVIGDKIVGRYGNKGIITKILEDHEMPYHLDPKGEKEHLEVALHPAGVPGRINPGQLLETAAAKIAKKTGKPYIVTNFDPNNKDVTRSLIKELKSHGLKDTESLIDPETGKEIGEVLTGPQFMQKLVHVASKKLTARGGAALPGMDSFKYDLNKQPVQGAPSGGQAMGALGIYALLGHNARANIKEMQTHKSTYERAEKPGEYDSDDYWLALMNGTPLPSAQPTFAVKKFEAYLKGMGVNTVKNAGEFQLVPLTDKDVLKDCTFEVTSPAKALDGKTGSPDKGGLFDFPDGDVASSRWGHVKLGGRVLNPVFEKPVATLLGISTTKIKAVLEGKEEVNGVQGMDAVVKALGKVNATKMRDELKEQVKTLSESNRDKAYKKIKLLNNLVNLGLTPKDAYTMGVMPVLPPSMRPVALSSASGNVGDIETVDINQLYRQVGQAIFQLKTLPKESTQESRDEVKAQVYSSVKAAYVDGAMNNRGAPMSSLLQFITNPKAAKGLKQGKEGFFQKKLVKRRYDLTGRSVITPEPKLSLDQVGIPRKMAMQIYRPFIVRELKASGYSPREAIVKLREDPKSEVVRSALERAMSDRPVLMKRDPALHKFNVLGFDPVITEGKSVQVHPLVVGGFNADFDGDTHGIFVPTSEEARLEAQNMKPSKNLFGSKDFGLMNVPTWGSAFGIYQLSEIATKGNKKFSTPVQAFLAHEEEKLKLNEGFTLNGKVTTIGRLKLHKALSDELKRGEVGQDILFGEELTKKNMGKVLERIARTTPDLFPRIVDDWKNLGNESAHTQAMSFGLKDYVSHGDIRDKHLNEADAKLAGMRNATDSDKVKAYAEASNKINRDLENRLKKSPNRLWRMTKKSGALASKYNQVVQMISSPLQVVDLEGNVVAEPIRKSYSEGMSTSDYWTTMPGVRTGVLSRAAGTSDPGARAKGLINLAINLPVMDDDCGTRSGVPINTSDKDLESRYLSEEVKLGAKAYKRNTLVDSRVALDIRKKLSTVKVRSSLTCALQEGVCKKCAGASPNGKDYEAGDALGVISAQSCSEPLTQMAMNAFHTGGSASGKGAESGSEMERVTRILDMPIELKGSAVIAKADGRVSKVEKDKVAGGFFITIGTEQYRTPTGKELLVKVGDTVKAAQPLCSGPLNPHHILEYAGMGKTRSFLVNTLQGVYGGHGVRRRHVETLVKNLTNAVQVISDPEAEFAPGDNVSRTKIQKINTERSTDGLSPVKTKPILKNIDSTVKLMTEGDYLAGLNYQGLRDVVLSGAAHGAKSNLHGVNPIPGFVYGHEFGEGKKKGHY
jgi:DNA-directed RNA polymerase subunit beta'